jgi:molybdopterin-guanine dinucleotide biosynthesis protein A
VTGKNVAADVAGFVLAGGGSRRFGQDKALVKIGDQPVLARLCSVLRDCTTEVKIVGSPEKYSGFGVECIPDRWPGEGPLGGIVTALRVSTTEGGEPAGMPASPGPVNAAGARRPEWNLIVGCDMPFLTSEWLRYLALQAVASEAEVMAPKSEHGLEPLCACWRSSAAGKLQRAFESGVRKVTEGMKPLAMEVLDETRWKRFDSADRLFWNMNTPGDYDEAKRILEAESA